MGEEKENAKRRSSGQNDRGGTLHVVYKGKGGKSFAILRFWDSCCEGKGQQDVVMEGGGKEIQQLVYAALGAEQGCSALKGIKKGRGGGGKKKVKSGRLKGKIYYVNAGEGASLTFSTGKGSLHAKRLGQKETAAGGGKKKRRVDLSHRGEETGSYS